MKVLLTISLLTGFAISLSAQWPPYKRVGVPRLPDGKVDLAAAAPRFFDGHPDLSGVWENPGWREGAAASGVITGVGGAPTTRSEPARRGPAPMIAAFFELGSMVPGGLPYQPWAKELKDKRTKDNAKDNPDAHCLPLGNMQLHLHPEPRKMIQGRDEIVILYEGNAGIRQIFTDGRPLPTANPQPWWFGYSTGKWDGDTLVVQTSGFRDGGWLDVNGSPLTDAGGMTEKFRRINYGTLELELTVDDPKAYTRPFSVKFTQRLMPDDELIEFVCQENERSSAHFK
ncbi:MAG TPA: hypothetical protein VLV86_01545 [Vicinamibacterales bacterium]|nr:hypothetical protein [Vicinamibacterales bacterium]